MWTLKLLCKCSEVYIVTCWVIWHSPQLVQEHLFLYSVWGVHGPFISLWESWGIPVWWLCPEGPSHFKTSETGEKKTSTQWRRSIQGSWSQLCELTCWQLNSVILEALPNLNDSVILKCYKLVSLPQIGDVNFKHAWKSHSCSPLLLCCRAVWACKLQQHFCLEDCHYPHSREFQGLVLVHWRGVC